MDKPRTTLLTKGLGWLVPTGRWKAALVTLMVAAAAFYIVSLRLSLAAERQGRAEDATLVATERADALEGASTARQSANERRNFDRDTITAETQSDLQELNRALAQEPDWASQPVPAAVADSLRAGGPQVASDADPR